MIERMKLFSMPKDIDEIKAELEDYYGTAMTNGFPMAVIDLGNLDEMDEEELRELAIEAGIDVRNR